MKVVVRKVTVNKMIHENNEMSDGTNDDSSDNESDDNPPARPCDFAWSVGPNTVSTMRFTCNHGINPIILRRENCSESDVFNHFCDETFCAQVKKVILPRDDKGTFRAKGFGYVEFEDRASLIEALSMIDTTCKNRRMRIEVADNVDQGRGGRVGQRERGPNEPDRTMGDWRSGPRSEAEPNSDENTTKETDSAMVRHALPEAKLQTKARALYSVCAVWRGECLDTVSIVSNNVTPQLYFDA
ncbi:Eukaryotic translation initiation factor 4B [Homalodisca vitripennis]|nr:Eukaryotic translation initiation factor 4B [Homalodisca vitripennis]